jgi:hypothetical protein
MRYRDAHMDEREGCALLKARFAAAGLAVAEHVRFTEDGIDVTLDGWDAARRVGYEYITTADGDRDQFTPEVVAALEARMRKGELYLLLLDERELPDADLLDRAADGFLAEIARRVPRP